MICSSVYRVLFISKLLSSVFSPELLNYLMDARKAGRMHNSGYN